MHGKEHSKGHSHSKKGKGGHHPSHAKNNKMYGLPADAYGHPSGPAPYGTGYSDDMPGTGSGPPQGANMGGGPEGPMSGGPGGMGENQCTDGDE